MLAHWDAHLATLLLFNILACSLAAGMTNTGLLLTSDDVGEDTPARGQGRAGEADVRNVSDKKPPLFIIGAQKGEDVIMSVFDCSYSTSVLIFLLL